MKIDRSVDLERSFEIEKADAASFFDEAFEAFLEAERAAGGPFDRFFEIGGYAIRLRFASPDLIPIITPALEHLAAEPTARPNLTICLWDSSLIEMPPPPWSFEDYRARGEVRGYNTDRISTFFNIGSGILSMLDRERDLALYWTRRCSEIPYYESGAPLQTILHLWMCGNGRRLVHAGAVGLPEGGALLAGKGGSGKSNTALSSLDSELFYLSDDYCLIAPDPKPFAYSLYSSGKLDPADIEKHPRLQSLVSNRERLSEEKALFFLHRHFPEKIISGFPVRAVLIPRVTGNRETRVSAASSKEAMMALAPSTIFQLSGAGHSAFNSISRFVKRVPCFNLELGVEANGITDAIRNLLARS